MLARMATAVFRSRPFDALVQLVERLDPEPGNILRVLTYHRVEREDASPPPQGGVTVSPDAFARQMEILESRCNVMSVDDVLQASAGLRRLPPRAVLITFDDGYRDFAGNAWPVLKALGLPVVVFIPTAFPGDPQRWFWWDRLHHALGSTTRRDVSVAGIGTVQLEARDGRDTAFTQLRARAKSLPHEEAIAWVEEICNQLGVAPSRSPVMDWDEIRRLAAQGVVFGSHTRTHPLLTRIPIEAARQELAAARTDLERELGAAPPVVAYPAGAFNDQVVRAAADEGYRLGFTTVRGVNVLGKSDPLRLRRINVGGGTNPAVLRGQLTGWFARVPGLRRTPEVP